MSYPKLTVANAVLKNGVHFVTADYKTRNPNYRNHNGIDLIGRNDKGEDYARDYIVAIADGVVDAVTSTYTKTLPNATGGVVDRGNWVRIKHPNGLYSCYFHMAVNTIKVMPGQPVHKGDILGYMGNTGYSKGNHLHFAVGNGKAWLDPLPYLTDATAWGGASSTPTTTETTVNGFKEGDKVHIISNSTNLDNGKKFPKWVYDLNEIFVIGSFDNKLGEPCVTFGKMQNGKFARTGRTYLCNCRKK